MRHWLRRLGPWLFLIAFILILVTSLGVFFAREGRAKSDQWSSIFSLFLGAFMAICSLLGALWNRLFSSESADSVSDIALTSLAQQQLEKWTAEEAQRLISDPFPISIRWKMTARTKSMMVGSLAVGGYFSSGYEALEGNYQDIGKVFRPPWSLPSLVLLGPPGSGKSTLILHLTLRLLDNRDVHDPVPVLLSVATWDPAQSLDDWLADQLIRQSLSLANRIKGPRGERESVARRMISQNQIIAVLDGFDEMAGSVRPDAISRIGEAIRLGRNIVLTSRIAEFESAVEHGLLPRSPVVEVLRASPSDVTAYLQAGTEKPDRWAAVAAQLRRKRNAPIKVVLLRPLMAWLARLVYERAQSDPNTLLRPPVGCSRTNIESHLLGESIKAAYGRESGPYQRRNSKQISNSRHYLGYLATLLDKGRSSDISWWQIRNSCYHWPILVGVIFTTLTGILVTRLVVALTLGPDLDALNGYKLSTMAGGASLMACFSIFISARTPGYPHMIFPRGKPKRIDFRITKQKLENAIPGLLMAGLLTVFLPWSFPVDHTRGLTVLLVSCFAFSSLVLAGVQSDQSVSPARMLKQDRAAASVLLLSPCLINGFLVFSMFDAWMKDPLSEGAVFGVSRMGAFSIGAISGLLVGTAALFWTTEWGIFTVSRVILACCGRLPWNLMSFLDEAHERGLLRQAGGVYQFRHALLQHHLADDYRPKWDWAIARKVVSGNMGRLRTRVGVR